MASFKRALEDQKHVEGQEKLFDQLTKDLRPLINDKETADVIFIVGKGEQQLYAHKLILWARCRSFRKYQRQFWRLSTNQGPLTFKYPQFESDVFVAVLHYIYTGQLDLQDGTVFSTLVISRDFGLEELRQNCEQYITSRLSVNNVCEFLAAALQLQEEAQDIHVEMEEGDFVEACLHFIELNAEQCVRSKGWLELPKDALIQLVSSQQFALEEDDVWRAVLSWAKYNAGIPLDKIPSKWNEHEKTLVSKALFGVIEHVKLLLIDSKVFAEEVEPTGIVSMEVSLERYRFAAVPLKTDQPLVDERLQPRVSLRLFNDTTLLTKEHSHFQRLINQWCGVSKQEWRLLFRASRDGFTSDAFHKHCDGVSPTIIVIKGQNDCLCGGFSDVPWTSATPPRGRFIPSHRAFLFTLVNKQGVDPTKFEVSNYKLATLHHPSYGPVFGAGADLCIANNCDSGMECYSNLPHTFKGEGASVTILMGDYNFNVLDYEVFTVMNNAVASRKQEVKVPTVTS